MSKIRKKILIVTYIFPPFAAVGVYRILKFCRYLTHFGIDPVILTPSNPYTMSRDEQLLKLVPEGIYVCRTYAPQPFGPKITATNRNVSQDLSSESRSKVGLWGVPLISGFKRIIKQNLSIPDGSYLWAWSGLLPGIRLVYKEDIDIILSSSPPPSSHVLASRLARLTDRPHIPDFRDLWTQNTGYNERKLPKYLQRRDRRFEKQVLKNASGVVVNTATFRRQLLQNNHFLSEKRIEVVSNGIDPDDFKNIAVNRLPNKKFTMLYTGSLYGRHRNPEFFFAAVRMWLDSNKHIESQIRIIFIGNWAPEYLGIERKYRLERIIENRGWLPQQQVFEEVIAADLLLLFQGFDPVLTASIPRKLYEYIFSNRPILAFAPKGEISDVINRYHCGICLPRDNCKSIIAYLSKIYRDWEYRKITGKTTDTSLRNVPELETKAQIGKLAQLCQRVA